MDRQIYLDLNRFARDTPWLHSVVVGYLHFGCIAIEIVLLVGALLLSGRTGISSEENADRTLVVAGVGAGVVAYAISIAVAELIDRSAPKTSLSGILVLTNLGTRTLPCALVAVTGALAIALLIARAPRLGLLASLLAVIETVASVYVGAVWPTDALAGLGVGILVALGAGAIVWLVRARQERATPKGARELVAGIEIGHGAILGPAAHQSEESATGAVRVLTPTPIRPLRTTLGNDTASEGMRSS